MRLIYTLLLSVAVSLGFAADGDTIIVKCHEDVVIQTDPSKGFTDYPAWAEFPDVNTDYYKVYAYLTFECAPGLRCGEWDYLNYIRLGRVGGVNGQDYNWELARYITPYGFYWEDGDGWKHGWYMDFTDYATLLRDSVEIVYRHTGYEARNDRGWKINLSFHIVEGKPVREPLNITRLWNGSFQYGNANAPIEDNLQEQTVTLGANTESATLKIIQTGHGADNTQNCAEFCPKERTVRWDGTVVEKRDIWRDCGYNSLYPQAGTWLYDRTDWCPGAPVVPSDYHFFNLTGGSTHTMDIDMEAHSATSGFGRYVFSTYLIEYGAPNYQHDVELLSVIAPSEEYQHLRYNPICDNPIIVIKNNGAQNLTSLDIDFGPPGSTTRSESWSGDLAFGEIDTVYLTTPIWWGGGADALTFALRNPNGQTDEFDHNNRKTVPVNAPPMLGEQPIIFLVTNKAASENYYYVRDLSNDSIIHVGDNLQNSTLYRDTMPKLRLGGCYQFEFYDDGPPPASFPLNEDGLGWWANSNDGSGILRILSGGGNVNFGVDFGEKIIYQFRAGWPLGVDDHQQDQRVEVYPNPTQGHLYIDYALQGDNIQLEVMNLNGQLVVQQHGLAQQDVLSLDLSDHAKGMYVVRLQSDRGAIVKKVLYQ